MARKIDPYVRSQLPAFESSVNQWLDREHAKLESALRRHVEETETEIIRTDNLEVSNADAHARISVEEIVRADENEALASRTTTLEATMFSPTTGLEATHARLLLEEIARATADTAEATARLTLDAQVNNVTTGLPATRARLIDEETARADADSAEAAARLTLDAQVNHATTGLPATLARLVDEEIARADADSAEATARLTLSAQVNHVDTGLPATLARLVTEETTRASADTALATRTTTLESTVNDATTGLPATLARLVTEESTRATADTAIASRATTLESQMAGTTASYINSRIATEETTRASADTALATRTTTLESTVNHTTTGLPATLARLVTEETTRASADTALATRATTLESQMAGTTASYVNSRIATEETTRASADTALATRATTLESQMSGGTASYINSRIATEETTRATADGALASTLSTVEARANGATASGAVYMQAVSTHAGASVSYGWYLNSPGGYRLGMDASADGGLGFVSFGTPSFRIYDPSYGNLQVFSYSAGKFSLHGDVSIHGNLMVAGTITGGKIYADGTNGISTTNVNTSAISQMASTSGGVVMGGPLGVTLTVRQGAYVLLQGSIGESSGSSFHGGVGAGGFQTNLSAVYRSYRLDWNSTAALTFGSWDAVVQHLFSGSSGTVEVYTVAGANTSASGSVKVGPFSAGTYSFYLHNLDNPYQVAGSLTATELAR